jgi:chaperone required for assembly of F1-ATPase
VTPRPRFWREARVVAAGEEFDVLLDARPLSTPRAAPMRLPSRALAAALAAEWNAVTDTARPAAMPFTRLANAAIDEVAPDPRRLVGIVAAYGETDLLCYRAEAPDGLRRRQETLWDPLLAWSAEALDAPLVAATGVMHRPQPEASLVALRTAVAAREPFALAALADLVVLSGSLVLGLAVDRDALEPDAAWALSRIDEDWQIARWGEDAEAAEAARHRRDAFLAAAAFLRLLGA